MTQKELEQLLKIPIIKKIICTILSPVLFIFQDDPNIPTMSYGQLLKYIWSGKLSKDK